MEPVNLCNLQDNIHKHTDNIISMDVNWTMFHDAVNAESGLKKRDSKVIIATLV